MVLGIYAEIKAQLSTRDVAEHFGFKVGRNGMTRCPFHRDSVPSMKVDQNYICFGCQKKGDVISFVSELFGLSRYEAAEKLVKEFGLVVSRNEKAKRKKRARKRNVPKRMAWERLEESVKRVFTVLCDYFFLLNKWAEEFAPQSMEEPLHPLFVEALDKRDHIEYLLDTLLDGSDEEKALVVIEKGKEIKDLEKRINSFKSGNGE